MPAEALISRLQKVRQHGDSYVACCPAHEDKTPSLTVKEASDGRVLVHCFAGCSVEDVLQAVGLDFDALFPEKTVEDPKPARVRFNAHAVLKAVSHELTVVKIIMDDMTRGNAPSDEDLRRFITAAQRIEEAYRYASL